MARSHRPVKGARELMEDDVTHLPLVNPLDAINVALLVTTLETHHHL